MTYPLVDIVIINYNGMPLLRQFLPSVAKLNYPNYEVMVVDNASTDDSVKFLKEYYPQFKIIQADSNYGTAEGSNIGVKYAKGEYIFFISNDMELDENILNFMVERMESDPKIGVCSCKMLRITESGEKLRIIDSVGADIDIFGFPSSKGIGEEDRGQCDAYREVFFSFGGALFIKKNIFDKTGGYDSEFFTLTDDIDLSWRVRLLGYKVAVEPKAFLYHRVSATLGSKFLREQKRFMSERNTLRTLLKNYSLRSLIFFLPVYFLILSAEAVFFLLFGKFKLCFSPIKAIMWNIELIKSTFAKRKDIQAKRVVKDSAILKIMRKKSHKLEIFIDFLKNSGSDNWKGYFN